MKFEKNYANLSISEITNTKLGVLNRKNTGVVEIMILEACDRCIQSKIKWQLTRALLAYSSPIDIGPDGFEEFVSEIEKGKVEKLSKEKSKDKSLDESEQLIYHSIHVLYSQLIRNSLFYVLKRFIQAQLNLTYDEDEPDYKKILTDNWKKISFTNLKKSLIVHISKQKNFLPLRIPKYCRKSKSSPKLPNATLHKKKSGPLKTGHHLPTLTIEKNYNDEVDDNETLSGLNDRMTLTTASAPESEQISPMSSGYKNQIKETNNEMTDNNTRDINESMNSNELLNTTNTNTNKGLSDEEQLILRKTPSMDLLKRSPYLLLRLLACMKPVPSLDNYPREKKLIENIIETVKQEEKLNADFISELGDSLSKLDDEFSSSQNLNSSSKLDDIELNSSQNLDHLSKSNSEIDFSQKNHDVSTNENIISKSENKNSSINTNTIDTESIKDNNTNTINNKNNSNINTNTNYDEADSSSSPKKINLFEELKFLTELSKSKPTSSIMNDISVQSPNSLINSIIFKNFEATGKSCYKKVPHYVTTIVPNPNNDDNNTNTNTNINNNNNNNNTTISLSTSTNTTNTNTNINTKSIKAETVKSKSEASIKTNTKTVEFTEPKSQPKSYLDLGTIDLKQNASIGNRFDHKIETNTNKNAYIVQKVNMGITIKKESLHNKKFEPTVKSTSKPEQNLQSSLSEIVKEKELKPSLKQSSILSDKIKREKDLNKNDNTNANKNKIELARESSINLRARNYDATTSITTATVYESGNRTVSKNDCLSSENLAELSENIKSTSPVSNSTKTTLSSTTNTAKNQNENKKVLKKEFSIRDQPHRKRYSRNNSDNMDNSKQTQFMSSESTENNNAQSPSNAKNTKHKKKYKHFIPVNLEDIITDVKEKAKNVVKEGKSKLSYNRRLGSSEKIDDNGSVISNTRSSLDLSFTNGNNNGGNGNSNSNSNSSLITSITPSTSTPTTFTTTSTVTTSIIKKGKSRVHHHLLYSKEPTPSHPDNFYEDNGRENDYYHLSHSRSSSFYDEKNISENGFQTPSSSPTNPLKKLN